MRAIRSYFAYIPLTQKLVQFVLMPLLAVSFGVLSVVVNRALHTGNGDAGIGVMVSLYLLFLVVLCDVVYDRGNFGGTFSSKASYMDYLKSSPRGLSFHGEILTGSMIVRILYAVVVTAAFRLVLLAGGLQTTGTALPVLVFLTGGTCLAAQLGSLLTRFFISEQTSMVAGMIAGMLVSMLFSVATVFVTIRGTGEAAAYLVTGLLALAAGILLAVLMGKSGIRKKEKEYYDV